MNLANKLTVSRIIAVPFVMVTLLAHNAVCNYLALIIFIAATITDLYDGKIARSRKLITPFGSFFDPIADKLLVSAVLICFVELHLMPAWMVIIIIFREFIISGLRILAARKGVDIPAGPLGKYKTVSQMVMIIIVLLYIALESNYGWYIKRTTLGNYTFDVWMSGLLYFLMLWVVFTTLLSGLSYIKKHWYLIVEGSR